MTHAFAEFQIRFPNFKGFAEDPGRWLQLQPITVLVGRNNAGKSAVIDALRVILAKGKGFKAEHHRGGAQARMEISKLLTPADLRTTFLESQRHGHGHATDWAYGQQFKGEVFARSYDSTWSPTLLTGPAFPGIPSGAQEKFRHDLIRGAAVPEGAIFQINAERNVRPEPETDPAPVQPDGTGLTNLIRGFLYDARYSMNEVEDRLKGDLNEIYKGDTRFERILCRRDPNGLWEIYLAEYGGHPIRLSQSGSSLRSVFTILATIRLNPIVDQKSQLAENIFCVEEPENNLHPSLLRRLLDFLATAKGGSLGSLVLTTHSSTAIDWASRRDDSAIFHIRRAQAGSYVSEARKYPAMRELLDDLDIRASEILQANGVIWVEGPSDRIYVRQWIEAHSRGTLKEGIHYTIMFYGGKLLSHLSALPPDEIEEAISLLRLNRNLAVIIDSDRKELKGVKFRADINSTKKRIIAEVQSVSGYVWITEGKEIENYLTPRILSELTEGQHTIIGKFDSVPGALGEVIGDKISLAHAASRATQASDLDQLDLRMRVTELCDQVYRWNS